jgi:hypothetical protein
MCAIGNYMEKTFEAYFHEFMVVTTSDTSYHELMAQRPIITGSGMDDWIY